MMSFKSLVVLLLSLGLTCFAQAQENIVISGQVSTEAGLPQYSSGLFSAYQTNRALLRAHEEFDNGLSWEVAGQADQQTSVDLMSALWMLYEANNRVKLEWDDRTDPLGTSLNMARLDRAFLKWVSGPLEVIAGLQSFDNGSANFYSPTHYFDPVPVLVWEPEPSLGSEGVNADCFLFDDLSLETSVRWLADGNAEGVFRLIDRGIGITLTPSVALLEGRAGTGLELSGTFPDFQVRFEGVNWSYPNNTDLFEWVGAVSTLVDKTKLTAQYLQDAVGDARGPLEGGVPGRNYLFASAQRDLTAQWQAEAAGLFPLNGGAVFFMPQVSWAFEPGWKLKAKVQWQFSSVLDAQDLAGLSIAYSF